jgi:hypothetical protein
MPETKGNIEMESRHNKLFPWGIAVTLPFIFAASSSWADQDQQALAKIEVVKDPIRFTLRQGDKNILSYQHAVQDVPKGVSPLFRRSAFIHPLWSPAGKILTRIQPPDHYHHYGIWNPWTLTHIDGRQIDFWNLNKGEGTVRFAGLKSSFSENGAGGFCVLQEHIDLKAAPGGRVSIEEFFEVKACCGKVEGRPVWIIDIKSRQKNVLDTPIIVDAYRYGGGLGFRATEQWTKENSRILTSEGKSRADADSSRARWCDVNGRFEDGQNAGIVFLSHPSNHQHPEPMRIWPLDANGGRGDVFFEFCPIRHKSWTLEPQKEYTLRYRMIVYDGTLLPEAADNLWNEYASSAQDN